MTAPGVDQQRFRELAGCFATGVTVLTTRTTEGTPLGMTASAVAAVSLDPPLVLVCVDRRHDMHPALGAARHFVLNVLAADQEPLSRRFADVTDDRFAGVAAHDNAAGVPVLDGVAAAIECERQGAVPAGDHTVFFGLVTGGQTAARDPLVHHRGTYTTVCGA
ncbi:MAG: flavin reductase family protein [Gemmatimonadales bacterium]